MQNGQDSGDTNTLGVKLTDSELLELIKKPIADSITHWKPLDEVAKINMMMWLPKHWEAYNANTYDFQENSLYQDPRIFTSVETIASVINTRMPGISVMPAQDTIVSLQVAKDIQKACEAYTKRYDILDLFRLSARNLQLKRGVYLKLRFDQNKGSNGEIVTELVQMSDTIVDKDAKMGQIPRFFTHIIRNNTVEELITMFPNGREKILKLAGVRRTDKEGNRVAYKSQLGQKITVYETWYRFLEDNEMKAGVCWTDEKLLEVFDNDYNPNWNYEEAEGRSANLLDEPAPPFIPINFLNDGESYIDQTSLIEQGTALQMILDKRGFQIVDNADQAGSGLVFNTQMISKTDIMKLTGSPDERIGVKGDVRAAVTRVAPPPLPNYVIEDKVDARNELDNLFATHDVSRGERSKNPTLGQDNLQVQGDMSRIGDIARAVERQATGYYRYLVQMMKVYYTEEHYLKAVGEDGQVDFVVMHADLIENGVDINVESGSMLPVNKESQQKWVSDLAKLGLVDPLTIYEVAAGGNMPSPKKMLERFMLFKTDPVAFMGKTKEDDFSREAYMDIQSLNEGKMPHIRDEYAPEYLNFLNNYMLGGEFEGQPELVKRIYLEHLKIVQAIISRQLAKLMTQMPTQQELDAKAQQEAQQAAIGQQLDAGNPQPSQGPGKTAGGNPKPSPAPVTA